MSNPPLDALLAALDVSGDPRLLVPALNLCNGDDEVQRVLVLAERVAQNDLSGSELLRLGQAALSARRADLALRFCKGLAEAMTVEVGALLLKGALDEAEARYRAVVLQNPTLEDPELLDRILAARTAEHGPSNVIALATGNMPASDPDADRERVRLAYADEAGIGFDDVGGHLDVKKQIERRIIAPFRKPSLFAKFRRKAGGGVLLYGPPGCGKTLLARATAGECEARFINVPTTDVLDKYIGEPERKLAAIFEDARRETPCVLFFDELEALAGKRGSGSTRHEMSIVSTFLAELDGFAQNNEGVLILAATNMPWAVDPAFRRSGRFDRLLFVPPPDKAAREEILRLQLAERPVDLGLKLGQIAKQTTGYSGADLGNLVDTAADYAIEESIDAADEVAINAGHLKEAFEEVKPTTAEWLTTARNFAKYGNSGGQYDEISKFIDKFGR